MQAWRPPRWLVWGAQFCVPVGTWPSMTTCMPTGEGALPCFSRNSKTPCSDTSRSCLQGTSKRANAWDAMQNRECRQQAVGPCLVGCKEVVGPAVILHVHRLQTSQKLVRWLAPTGTAPALDKQQSPACFGLTEKLLSGYLELLVLVITRVSPCCLSPTTVSCIRCAAVHDACSSPAGAALTGQIYGHAHRQSPGVWPLAARHSPHSRYVHQSS